MTMAGWAGNRSLGEFIMSIQSTMKRTSCFSFLAVFVAFPVFWIRDCLFQWDQFWRFRRGWDFLLGDQQP